MTTPSLFAYPQDHIFRSLPQQEEKFGDWWWSSEEQASEWIRPTKYDEIMQMLEDLESGQHRIYPKNE